MTVHDDAGEELTPSGVRLRVLLAALLLHANAPVPADALAEAVWDGKPPPGAPQTLRSYVRRLRQSLGPVTRERIVARDPGYLVRLDDSELDVLAFDLLCREASAALRGADWDRASTTAAKALDLWRGTPLIDVRSQLLRDEAVPRLEQLRLQALEDRVEADLRLGRQEQLVPLLRALTAQHRLREHFHAQYMIALCRCGRQADALAAYRDARQTLVEELGIEPGPELRRLHSQVLAGDVDLLTPRPIGTAPTEPTGQVPRQLPAPPQSFTGRDVELADLDKIHDASTVVITAIDGMAGVGKTALAVRAAHQMVDRYPDGQLFIDLHGYTDGVAPVGPSEALNRMLRSCGVPAARIPDDLDERAGLYRSRLADQRVLIVLDNASTEAQVTPLLPGSPGCLVLVTSRRRLTGLDHTYTLSLDTLPPADAVALFRRGVNESRLAGQPPDLVTELVELCGRLPLAIRIAAARLRSHPTWDLSHLTARMRDQQHRLVELTAGQRSVTAALDLSYQDLSAELQRTYRLLGQHFGPDIDAYAAAALLDATLPEAGQLLEQLLDAHLLQELTPGRYRFHDLVRAHAAHTAGRDENAGRAALDRLLDHYRRTAALATDVAYPYERERRPPVPPARTPGPTLPGPVSALGWFDGELPNLLAAARYATEHDRPADLLSLSTILQPHLRVRGPHEDAVTLHQQALTIARTTGNQPAELETLVSLGHIHRLQSRYEQATDQYQQALRLARATGNQAAGLDALNGLGTIHLMRDVYERAGDHYQQALRLARATGHQPAELTALTGLGRIHLLLGRHEQATDHYEQLLDLARQSGNRNYQFEAWQGLGRVQHVSGHPDTALTHHRQALALATELGQPTDQARAHNGLAHDHHALHQLEQAGTHWQRALDILTRLGIDNTAEEETSVPAIRSHLADLGPRTGPRRR